MKRSWRRMGSIVTVLEVYELERSIDVDGSKERRRWWKRVALAEKRTGWVVGYRTIFDGIVKPGRPRLFPDEDYGPPYLNVTASHPCLLVAFTPYSKPVRVPAGCFYGAFAGEEPHAGVPGGARKVLSEDAKNFERDARGRFV